jgi:hypothetical protein
VGDGDNYVSSAIADVLVVVACVPADFFVPTVADDAAAEQLASLLLLTSIRLSAFMMLLSLASLLLFQAFMLCAVASRVPTDADDKNLPDYSCH